MTGRYVERDADPLQRAADAVANRIAAAMEAKEAAVAPLVIGGEMHRSANDNDLASILLAESLIVLTH